MKNSDKFWIVIFVIVFIIAQFNPIVVISELFSLGIIIGLYLIFCLFDIVIITENSKQWNVLYWIVYLPIIKFNKFLNNL